MKSYLRFLWRNKLYTAIELVGLAVALSFVLFITVFVVSELTYDRQLKNTDNIFVGVGDKSVMMSYTMGDMTQSAFPEIEAACGFIPTGEYYEGYAQVSVENEKLKQKAFVVDKEFFDFFTFPFVEGDRATALLENDAVVVSQSFANRYFSDKPAIGQTITITIDKKRADLCISAIMKDIEHSVFPAIDLIYGIQHIKNLAPNEVQNGNGSTVIFYKVKDGSDIEELQSKILAKAKQEDQFYKSGWFKVFTLSPFSQIRYGVCDNQRPFVSRINLNFVLLFSAAGVLLLLFAILNYISLTVAQVGFRAREMATRQLLGEQRLQIIWRYVKEAFLLTFAAFCISLIIIEVLQPYFGRLLGKEIDVFSIVNLSGSLIILLFLFLISFITGVVPALIVSKYKPISVVKGEFAVSVKMTLGRAFILFQNAVAIATLCIAFAMFLQFKHLLARDCGYNKDNIISIAGAASRELFYEDEIRKLPFIESIGHTNSPPVYNAWFSSGYNYNGGSVNLTFIKCDTTAFNILGFRVMNTSNVDVTEAGYSHWLTEGTMNALGLVYGTDNVVLGGYSYPVCGIIRNFQMGNASIEESIAQNLCVSSKIYNAERDFQTLRCLLVKVIGNENEALQQIRDFYKEKGVEKINIVSFNEAYRQYFESEENHLELISIFTMLVIMLSSLAMLAMSTYFAKQNARNYSIKKVFGYESSEIYYNMVGRFLKIVWLAAVVAIPVGYYIVGEWLSGYSYRISNYWWIYLTALVMVAVVAVGVISWQAVRLMNANPVEELKKE